MVSLYAVLRCRDTSPLTNESVMHFVVKIVMCSSQFFASHSPIHIHTHSVWTLRHVDRTAAGDRTCTHILHIHTVAVYERQGELSDVWGRYVPGGLSWRRGECVI